VDYERLITALKRPASTLGVLPELATVRPQLQVHLYETLGSTNQQAWHWVEQGAGAGTVVIARQQQAGRGQWGRTWASPPGGLYLSLILTPAIAIAAAPLLTLASAWGIATSLNQLGVPIQLKWPNDLVHQGRKVGGILTETRLSREPDGTPMIQTAVVGIGVNWDNPLPEIACSLRQLLPDPPPEGLKTLEDLAVIVLRGCLQGYHYWQHQGTEQLIHAYEQKLAHRGQEVSYQGHLVTVMGVSATGDLTIRLPHAPENSIRTLKPGEISLGYHV
jgi:BirA family biotin operon repressor/biotin-[acetyl-CoA-carboxylase] ligase